MWGLRIKQYSLEKALKIKLLVNMKNEILVIDQIIIYNYLKREENTNLKVKSMFFSISEF